ncbi:MAG: hypothetical protein ACPG4U_09475 [Pseudomonadales bacterium]
MLYNAMGLLSSAMFLGCLFGLVRQFRLVGQRKLSSDEPGYATQSLSVNSFFSSFVAFYAFFLYSIMLAEVDYYLFVTRLLAASMTLLILYQIYSDRASLSQRLPFLSGLGLMVLALGTLGVREELLLTGRTVATALAVGATFVMLQGGIQQIRKIAKAQTTGALSLSMNAIFMAKDVANMGFGAVLGFADGWPLLLIGGVSATIKAVIIGQFYHYRANR